MNVVIIIPAYNEEKTIGDVISKCRTQNTEHRIIVVNDGSTDKTAEKAREAGALVLSHPINRGLGAALSTGLAVALELIQHSTFNIQHSVLVTLDADGQHDPAEIPKLIEPILRGEAEVVIGSRFLKFPISPASVGPRQGGGNFQFPIPLSRRTANWFGNLITYLLFGIRVTDSQSGFRAFSRGAAEKLRIRTNTMEVSSEIIREIKLHNWRLKEVPIKAIYTGYSLSKGQGFLKGLETLWKLIVLKFFR